MLTVSTQHTLRILTVSIQHTVSMLFVLQDGEYEEFVALADYQPMDSNELLLTEGDLVQLSKVGSEGWWFVRHLVTGEEGWTPASYLESTKRRSTHSNHSTHSTLSTNSGSQGKTRSLIGCSDSLSHWSNLSLSTNIKTCSFVGCLVFNCSATHAVNF